MFNLFVSVKPNIEKFTLLIEKSNFSRNEGIKYKFFQQNLDSIGHF